jgi:phosphoribosylformylglycinamidine (FGAM) synthase-like amidotransferase family enzyme
MRKWIAPGVLLRNSQQQFVCKNVYVKEGASEGGCGIKLPVAHGEGRYFADLETLEQLEMHRQIIYRYLMQMEILHQLVIRTAPCIILRAFVIRKEMYLE